jgi:hypothetical protein
VRGGIGLRTGLNRAEERKSLLPQEIEPRFSGLNRWKTEIAVLS